MPAPLNGCFLLQRIFRRITTEQFGELHHLTLDKNCHRSMSPTRDCAGPPGIRYQLPNHRHKNQRVDHRLSQCARLALTCLFRYLPSTTRINDSCQVHVVNTKPANLSATSVSGLTRNPPPGHQLHMIGTEGCPARPAGIRGWLLSGSLDAPSPSRGLLRRIFANHSHRIRDYSPFLISGG